MHKWFTMTDSFSLPSSSSSLDGLSFILKECNDETPRSKYLLDDETDIKKINILMKLGQGRQKKSVSSSSWRPKKKKKVIRRDLEEVHGHSYEDYFAEDTIYNENFLRIFRLWNHLILHMVKALRNHFEYF